MSDEYLEQWLIKASHDLRTARNELKNSDEPEDILTDIICFHAQQAAEKYLKAFLIFSEVEFGRSHSLEYLVQLCTVKKPAFASLETGNLS